MALTRLRECELCVRTFHHVNRRICSEVYIHCNQCTLFHRDGWPIWYEHHLPTTFYGLSCKDFSLLPYSVYNSIFLLRVILLFTTEPTATWYLECSECHTNMTYSTRYVLPVNKIQFNFERSAWYRLPYQYRRPESCTGRSGNTW